MEVMIKEDLSADDTNDSEIEKLNERIKELEQQIVKIVEVHS